MGGFLDQLAALLSQGGTSVNVGGQLQPISGLDPFYQRKSSFGLLDALLNDPSSAGRGGIGGGSVFPNQVFDLLNQGLRSGQISQGEGTNYLSFQGVNSPLSVGSAGIDYLNQYYPGALQQGFGGLGYGPGVPISGGSGGAGPSDAPIDPRRPPFEGKPPLDGGAGGGGVLQGRGVPTGTPGTGQEFPGFPSGGQAPFTPTIGLAGTEGEGAFPFLPGDRFDRNVAFGGNAFLEALIPYLNPNPFPGLQGGLASLFQGALGPKSSFASQFGSPLGSQFGGLTGGSQLLQGQFNPFLDTGQLNSPQLMAQQLGYFQRFGLPNQQQQLGLSSALQGFGGDAFARGFQGLQGLQQQGSPLLGSGQQQLGLGGQAVNSLFADTGGGRLTNPELINTFQALSGAAGTANQAQQAATRLFQDTQGGQLANPELIRAFQGLSNSLSPFQTGSPFPNGPNPPFPFNQGQPGAGPSQQAQTPFPSGGSVSPMSFGNVQAPGVYAQAGPTQGAAEQGVLDLIQRGGTSQTNAQQAQERRLLDPQVARSRNEFTRLAGPDALLQGSDQQERERKLRRDFLDQQLISADSNLLQGFGQGAQLGQQQFGQQFGLGQQNAANLQRAGEFNTGTLLSQIPIQAQLQNQMFNQRTGLTDLLNRTAASQIPLQLGAQGQIFDQRTGLADLFNRSGLASLQGSGQALGQGLDLNQALLGAGLGGIQAGQGVQSQLIDQYFNQLNPALERALYGPLQQQQQLELGNRGFGLQELAQLQQFLQGQQAFGQGNLGIGGQLFSSLLGGQPPRSEGSTLGGILTGIGGLLGGLGGIPGVG